MSKFKTVEEWLYYLSVNHKKIKRILSFDFCDTICLENDECVTVKVDGSFVTVMDGETVFRSLCNSLILERYLYLVKDSEVIEKVCVGGAI